MSSSSDNRQASAIKGGTGTTPTPANTDTSGRRRVSPFPFLPSPTQHHVLNPSSFHIPFPFPSPPHHSLLFPSLTPLSTSPTAIPTLPTQSTPH